MEETKREVIRSGRDGYCGDGTVREVKDVARGIMRGNGFNFECHPEQTEALSAEIVALLWRSQYTEVEVEKDVDSIGSVSMDTAGNSNEVGLDNCNSEKK